MTAALAAVSLSACGGGGQPHPAVGAQARAVAQANARHEYPAPAAPVQRVSGIADAARAVSAFARLYINWTAADVAMTMAHLARLSVGQARSEMTLAAADARADPTLTQGEISNRGAVEAVSRLSDSRNRYVVVTLETTSSAVSSAYRGLAPAWHVTLATVTAVGPAARRRWAVTGWQPEN